MLRPAGSGPEAPGPASGPTDAAEPSPGVGGAAVVTRSMYGFALVAPS